MSSRAFSEHVRKAASYAESSGTSAGRVIGETLLDVLEDEEHQPDDALRGIIEAELDAIVGTAEDVRARIMGVRKPPGRRRR
jgi:hypothetical protein